MFKNLILLGILAIFPHFSQAYGFCEHWNETIKEVLANEAYCVKSEKEGKIYLNSENIRMLAEGLYLDLNGHDMVPLPLVLSDIEGCFIPTNDYTGEPPMPVYCPKCKRYHSWPPCSIKVD